VLEITSNHEILVSAVASPYAGVHCFDHKWSSVA
jgi:hypothetical protein